ncbi:DNA-3-methyladenine glycosylase family protein [Caloramator sp. E03]|uniref:DNA-3-methyladenine glycosylase family protein n=1 Tax=Caloramator sp. E03 TaxID=2576307 RepID=UPI001A9B9E01|nr:DNA glycosylase [Caloramator sp. E03]
MEKETFDKGIVFKNIEDFDLKHTFDCGQCFRWIENNDGSFTGVAFKKAVRIYKKDKDIYIEGAEYNDAEFWKRYLDLNRDYKAIKDELSKDEVMEKAIKYGWGIRILNQDMFETVISFIISANNRIPMIKRTIENICREYGDVIELSGKKYYTFPSPKELAKANIKDLENLGCGFRAKYIVDTTKDILNGACDLDSIRKLDTDDAQRELMKLKGIGPKVADCILLFSMGKHDAFPVDVWVKRVMQYFYLAPDVSLKKIRDFARKKFGNYAGFAQEYLFYYAREFMGREGLSK